MRTVECCTLSTLGFFVSLSNTGDARRARRVGLVINHNELFSDGAFVVKGPVLAGYPYEEDMCCVAVLMHRNNV